MSSANRVSNSRRGKTVANTITTWGTVTAGAFFSPQAHAHHQEGCQHDQRPRMMPSGPTPPLILAHPQPWLAVCTTRCDGPPPPAHPPARFHRRVNGGLAQGGLQLPRLNVPPPHHPDVRPRQGVSHGEHS